MAECPDTTAPLEFPSPLEGEDGNAKALPGGGSTGKHLANNGDHSGRVCEHIVVPEAQDSVTSRFEPLGALGIVSFVPGMLPAVYLDDQQSFGTEKVHYIGSDGLLTAEAKPVELLSSYSGPQANFRLGRRIAQLSGDGRGHVIIVAFRRRYGHPPPLTPAERPLDARPEHASGMFGGVKPPPQGGRVMARGSRAEQFNNPATRCHA